MQFQIVNPLQSSSRSSTGPSSAGQPPQSPTSTLLSVDLGGAALAWTARPTPGAACRPRHPSGKQVTKVTEVTEPSRVGTIIEPSPSSIPSKSTAISVWGRLQASRFPPEWNRAETQCRSARILSREIMLTAPRHCPQTRHRQLATHLAAH